MSRYRVFAGRNPRVVSIKEWQPLKRFEPKVEGISLLPTTRCTAYCAHCFICANDNAATMEREMLMDVIEQIRDIPTINSFLWNGGECTLCFEDMVKGTRLIKERYPHIVVSMLSNGWFGNKDPEKIIGKLADAGMDFADISTSIYHVPYVRHSEALRAMLVAKEKLPQGAVLSNTSKSIGGITPIGRAKDLPDTGVWDGFFQVLVEKSGGRINERDKLGVSLDVYYFVPEDSRPIYGTTVHHISRMPVCRALSYAEYEFDEGVTYVKRDNRDLTLTIRPEGKVYACCWNVFELGDISKESMRDIVERAYENVELKALMQLGPLGVAIVRGMDLEVVAKQIGEMGACAYCVDVLFKK